MRSHRTSSGRSALRRLAAARFVSSGGTTAAQVALAYTIYERTGSAAWVSASLVASAGVTGAMGPISGRLSDRLDRRRVMVVSEVAGAAGWLAVLLVHRPVLLVLAALVATAANAPFKASSSAAVPDLVDPDELPWANGVIATALNASMVVGPLVGGALLGVAGPRSVFAVNVVTFLASAVVLRGLPARSVPSAPQDRTGPTPWRRVLADPTRRLLILTTALSFGAFGVILVADVPMVDELGGGSVAYALLTTLWGVGAVAGSWAAGRLTEEAELRAVRAGTAVMAVAVTSFAVAPNLPTLILAGAIGGLGSGVVFAPWYSLLQRSAADHERGTTFAVAETVEQGAFLAGMTVAGAVVGLVGPQATYLLPGTLLLGASLAARRLGSSEAAAPTAVPAAI